MADSNTDTPVRAFDGLSFLTGVLALLGAGLYVLDDSGTTQVDEAVVGAALVLALGLYGLVRSVLTVRTRWQQRRSAPG